MRKGNWVKWGKLINEKKIGKKEDVSDDGWWNERVFK